MFALDINAYALGERLNECSVDISSWNKIIESIIDTMNKIMIIIIMYEYNLVSTSGNKQTLINKKGKNPEFTNDE